MPSTKVTIQRNYAFVQNIKTESPCTDCGLHYPYYVMHFDHLGDKTHKVSRLANAGASIDRLKLEIAKCELVCANCHAIRTHERRLADLIFAPEP